MPGIAGIINRMPAQKNERDIGVMVGSMIHEPFYSSGIYVNEQLYLYAGWVSHKGSFSDCMPVLNEKKDVVLLFSGENFVDNGVTDALKIRGHEFDCSNASYLVHLYEEDEDGFFKDLNGWFSGIVVDLRKGKVVLFNDRYGMERIYYYESKDELVFSSEAKALLKVRPQLREIDLEGLGQFFTCGCVLENRTLFSNVFLLPGGSAWTFRNGNSAKKDRYFKLALWENQPVLEREVFYRRLKETFLNILPRYFCKKDQIAMSLSSGLDTRVIMSSLDNQPGRLPCYSFGGMIRDTFDVRIARKVADACDQEHHVFRLDGNFLSDFPNLAEKTIYVTDGYHDVLGSHDIYFNSFAREIAPIRMTGKFGSEVLGNHSMLKKGNVLCKNLFDPDFQQYITRALASFNHIKKGHKLSFSAFKEIPWHEYGRLAVELSKLTLRTPYMDNELIALMYQAPENVRSSKEIRLRLIEDGNPILRKIFTDRGTAGKSNCLFSKCAQLFCYSLVKAEYIYLYQLPHWLAKLDHAFAPLHPENLVLGRYQFGHYRIWFRNELADYVRSILLDIRAANRPYLNKPFLSRMVDGHIRGEANYLNEINKTLTAELIHRLFIDSN